MNIFSSKKLTKILLGTLFCALVDCNHHAMTSRFYSAKLTKIFGLKPMVFSSQLRKFPKMIVAHYKYTGYIFTSPPISMMSSAVAMETLCITSIGFISSNKIAGVDETAVKMSDCNISFANLQKYFKCTGKHSV